MPLGRRTAPSRVTVARGGLCGDQGSTRQFGIFTGMSRHIKRSMLPSTQAGQPDLQRRESYPCISSSPGAMESKETNTFQLFLSLQEEGRTRKKISLLIVLLKERRKRGGGIIILPCPEGDRSSDTLSRHHKLCVH